MKRTSYNNNLISLNGYDYDYNFPSYQDEYDAVDAEGIVTEVNDTIDLTGVQLHGANLQNVDFSNSNIIAAEMRFSELQQTNFSCSLINMSDMYGSNFKDAMMDYAEIRNTNLSYSNFSGANLNGALISNCDLSCSDLRGANLNDCVTSRTKFTNSVFDKNTILPFTKEKAEKLGMIYVQDNYEFVS